MLRSGKIQNLCRILPKRIPVKPNLVHANIFITNPKFFPFLNLQQQRLFQVSFSFRKYNKKSSQDNDSDDENDEVDEFKDERDSKVVKTKVNSLRADLLLKAGIGMARNKVETFFYESKIRVNGKKVPKKSVQLNTGDEIDVVRGFSQTNPSHLVVSRVIILTANPREDNTVSVQLRRYKSLLIENYSGPNAYKSSDFSDHHPN